MGAILLFSLVVQARLKSCPFLACSVKFHTHVFLAQLLSSPTKSRPFRHAALPRGPGGPGGPSSDKATANGSHASSPTATRTPLSQRDDRVNEDSRPTRALRNLVIGGGHRGRLRTGRRHSRSLGVERGDCGSETSSRSTKLIWPDVATSLTWWRLNSSKMLTAPIETV